VDIAAPFSLSFHLSTRMSSTIAVHVRAPGGMETFDVLPSTTTKDLVQLVADRTSLKTEKGLAGFRLRFHGVFMKLPDTLEAAGVKLGDELVVALNTRDTPLMQARRRLEAGTTKKSHAHKETLGAIKRLGEDINAHTDGAVRRALREELCPGLKADATEKEELDSMRAKRKAEDLRMGVLRKREADEKAAKREARAAEKAEKAAKPKRGAKAVAVDGSVQLCGHVSAKGIVCKRPAPCSSHDKKAYAEKKRREAAESAVVVAVESACDEPAVEQAVPDADDGMEGFLVAQGGSSP